MTIFPSLCPLQSLFFSCECGRSDAARALPSRCTDRPGHPSPRSPDQHTEPWGGGVRCHHQQPHTPCLHRRQGLCQDLGHKPTRQQEPSVPTRLPGKSTLLFSWQKSFRSVLLLWMFQSGNKVSNQSRAIMYSCGGLCNRSPSL